MLNQYQGGSYLFGATDPKDVLTSEDLSDEHRMIGETVTRFVAEKILPRMDEIEEKKAGLMRELIAESAELGLLGADVAEEYGGIQSGIVCSTVIAEKIGCSGSFSLGSGVCVGIGALPIVYFGNKDQKSRYLPDIVSAKKIPAYALTESDAGSDAMSIKTKAVLSEDGKHFILSGSKCFISNAGIADLFIVYAKIDGEQFSAFIVDVTESVSTGPEEHKMGIRGSSTCMVYFDKVKVPVENLLHLPGKGHHVAFNILNFGRHHISGNALGVMKYALDLAAAYANERKQFKTPIAKFGMIKEKLAEMAASIYAAESVVYRNGGMLEARVESLNLSGDNAGQILAKGIEDYAIECSLEKVFVTEVEAYVVDEAVQIHGGYGFIADYPVERLYRDARVHRIFEGTNEINRTLVVTTLLRRADADVLPLPKSIEAVMARVKSGDMPARHDEGDLVQGFKDVFCYTLGLAHQRYGEALTKEQETLGCLADIAIYAYAGESVWVRTQKAVAAGGQNLSHKQNMTTLFIHTAAEQVALAAREVVASLASGEEMVAMFAGLANLLRYERINIFVLRRNIAAVISQAGKYVC